MALVFTSLTSGSSNTAGATETTAAVTLTAGRSYLLWGSQNRGGALTLTSTGWSTPTGGHIAFDNLSMDLLYRDGDGSTGTITLTWSGAGSSRKAWGIMEVTDQTTGAGLIVQAATASNAGSTTPNVTLSSFASANNVAVLGFITDLTGTHGTAGTGYTLVHDVIVTGNNGAFLTQYKTAAGTDTNPTANSPSTEWVAIGAQISAASAGASQWGAQMNHTWNRIVQTL